MAGLDGLTREGVLLRFAEDRGELEATYGDGRLAKHRTRLSLVAMETRGCHDRPLGREDALVLAGRLVAEHGFAHDVEVWLGPGEWHWDLAVLWRGSVVAVGSVVACNGFTAKCEALWGEWTPWMARKP